VYDVYSVTTCRPLVLVNKDYQNESACTGFKIGPKCRPKRCAIGCNNVSWVFWCVHSLRVFSNTNCYSAAFILFYCRRPHSCNKAAKERSLQH